MTALLIIVAILLVFVILLMIPSIIDYSFVWNENEKKTVISFRYLFFKIVLIPKDKKTKQKTKQKKKYKFEDVINDFNKYSKVFKTVKGDIFNVLVYSKNHAIVLKRINLSLKFDFDDPMKTGIHTGTINGVVYNFLGILDNNMTIERFNVDIIPLFENRNYFDINLSGIVKIRNVHIMVMLFKIIKIYNKVKKIK